MKFITLSLALVFVGLNVHAQKTTKAVYFINCSLVASKDPREFMSERLTQEPELIGVAAKSEQVAYAMVQTILNNSDAMMMEMYSDKWVQVSTSKFVHLEVQPSQGQHGTQVCAIFKGRSPKKLQRY